LAKIAIEQASAPPSARILARGKGWAVSDIICTAGPLDRPFEEQHSSTSIAIVVSGTFQYRSSIGQELMTPASVLLGNDGDCYCCGHEHGIGDRCISVSYNPDFFERLAHDVGRAPFRFPAPRIPALRAMTPLVADGAALLQSEQSADCEEFVVRLAAQAIELVHGIRPNTSLAEAGALARVTQVVRLLDWRPQDEHTLTSLANIARLSPYYFLRTFQSLTGTTPHQYVLRLRLRRAGVRLRTEKARVIDIALDSGFNDVTNFNRTFRAEFGLSPRAYRAS
jgi:AraC family transcriptional regulator